MRFPLLHAARPARILIAAFAAAAGLLLGSLQAEAQAPGRVALPLFNKPGHAIIPNLVDIEVGGGPPARVTFDTGSTGLRILESAVGPHVRRTEQPVSEVYGDGTELKGYLGYAEVAFRTLDGSALRTVREVPVHVVTQITCSEAKPHCPGLVKETVGIMGVRFDRKAAGMMSPLRFLPGALANGFVVDVAREGPHVRLGLDGEDTHGFRFAALRPANPATAEDGAMPLWIADSIQACFSVEGSAPACGPVIFDTGGSAMDIAMEGLPPELMEGEFVRAGARVSFEVPDAFHLTFRSEGHHDVRIRPGHGANSGERFFRHYVVAYDGQNGRIGFLPHPWTAEDSTTGR